MLIGPGLDHRPIESRLLINKENDPQQGVFWRMLLLKHISWQENVGPKEG